MLPAGLTGYQGFLLTPEELGELAPLTAEVLTDLISYDAYWVKLTVLMLAFAGIESKKMDGFRKWKAEQAKDARQTASDRVQISHKNNADPAAMPPAPDPVKRAPAAPEFGGLPPAPGVDPKAKARA